MKHKFLIATVLVAFSTSAIAQEVNFGVKAGTNLNTVSAKVDGEKEDDTEMTVGLLVGAFADINFNETFALETGLQFEQKGFKLENTDYGVTVNTTANVNYLTIPVNFRVNVPAGENNFYMLAGPSVGIGLSGKLKAEAKSNGMKVSDSESIEFGDSDDSDLKRVNIGVGFGIGFELACNLGIRVGYDLGVSNLQPKGDSDNFLKFSSTNIALTFKF